MTPTAAPAASPPVKRMTAAEFWDYCLLPENEHRDLELIRGEVVEVSRATRTHGRVCVRFAYILERYVEAVGVGYVVSNDSGVVLGADADTVLGPDVAYFVGATRWEELPEKWGDDVPLLAVEVRSPNDRPGQVNRKVQEYLSGGVRVVWVADYEKRTVTIHRPGRGAETVGEAGELVGGDDLPGLAIKVADLFRLPGGPPPAAPSAGPTS